MRYFLFAKFLQDMSVPQLMDACKQLGFDGPTALVREGYWVQAEDLLTTLPPFVKEARAAGLTVEYADTDFAMADLETHADQLKCMRDCGITQFRLDWIRRTEMPVRELPEYTKRAAAHAAEVAEKCGVRAVMQIHGNFYPHSATAAWPAVKDLDPRWFGVKIDPGNNLDIEGYEFFDYQIPLLGEHITALGAKDAGIFRDGDMASETKGWQRRFVPAQEGLANYPLIFRELKKVGFTGPAVLMPFYCEEEPDKLLANLKVELAYYKQAAREAGLC